MQSELPPHTGNQVATCPRLPDAFRRVGGLLPLAPTYPLLRRLIRQVFSDALAEGLLEPLAGREMVIVIEDLGIRLGFTQAGDAIQVTAGNNADAEIRGPAAAFIWLAAKRADADTLFFHRHLVMEGDTELGLVIKNLLDATGLESLPPALRQMLEWTADRLPAQPPGAASMPG